MDIFAEKIKNFTHEAFRLETLPEYRVDGEWQHFQAYLAGKPTVFEKNDWHDLIAQHRTAGRKMIRLRLLPEDMTPYLEYELLAYQQNLLAGEEIFFLPDDACEDLVGQIPKDAWMFDGETIIQMNYGETGDYKGSALLENAAALDLYKQLRTTFMQEAIPAEEFFRSLRG